MGYQNEETNQDNFKKRSIIRRRMMHKNYHDMIEIMEVLFDTYDMKIGLYAKGEAIDEQELHQLDQKIESMHYQITELRENYSIIEDSQLKDEISENIERT